VTIEGIPEKLPPVAETAERSRSLATEPRWTIVRRRNLPISPEQEDDQPDDGARESHVLDDLL